MKKLLLPLSLLALLIVSVVACDKKDEEDLVDIELSVTTLNFGKDALSLTFTVKNVSGQSLEWETKEGFDWLNVKPSKGKIESGTSLGITVTIDRSKLNVGDIETNLSLITDGHTRKINVTALKGPNPTIALNKITVFENQTAGTLIGNLTMTNATADDTFTYALVSGIGSDDNASFSIDGTSLKSKASFDYEVQNTHTIGIRATDKNGETLGKVFLVTVVDINEPTTISLSNNTIVENQVASTLVGILTTATPDENDTFTYALVSGNGSGNNASFFIDGSILKSKTTFDHETKSNYTVRIQTKSENGTTFSQAFNITVTNANEKPTDIALSKTTIAENKAAGTVVGNLTTADIDANDTFTYALVSGDGSDDNASFEITGDELKILSAFDFEKKSTYKIRIRTIDKNRASFTKTYIVMVADVNEKPTDIALSKSTIAENQTAGTLIGNLITTDADANDTFTYTLVTTNRSSALPFFIEGASLKAKAPFNYEAKKKYTVRIQTFDKDRVSFTKDLTVTVTDMAVEPFISTWETTFYNETITIPTAPGARYNYTVNWGDGTPNATLQTGNASHIYAKSGIHTVQISGTFPRIYFNNTIGKEKFISIKQWGNISWSSMKSAFYGCSNMIPNVISDAPDLSKVTDMSRMFQGSSFNGDLSTWDVSKVTNMRVMFKESPFNGDLSTWDVSKVTDMTLMFHDAIAFNGDLSKWNVSNVTHMVGMFSAAESFNSDISQWNVSNVIHINGMFSGAKAFNKDLSQWKVLNVISMSVMFSGAEAFNSDLSKWNVSKVTDMSWMFYNATAFNRDLSLWKVSNVTNMSWMFANASIFNSDLSKWNVSKVTNMKSTFSEAKIFNSDLSKWDVSKVTDMAGMFYYAQGFSGNLNSWNVSGTAKTDYMFSQTIINKKNELPTWCKALCQK